MKFSDFHTHLFVKSVAARMSSQSNRPDENVNLAIWSLIRRGLIYLPFHDSGTGKHFFDAWIRLTDAGRAAARDEESPEIPHLYLGALRKRVPNVSDVVFQYMQEAVIAYENLCNLASTVMIGVASEAAFLETMRAFDQWLGRSPNPEGTRFRKALHDGAYVKPLFDKFQPSFASKRGDVPPRVRDGIEQVVSPVFNLLRVYRNDAGHPAHVEIDRDDVTDHLGLFPRYLQRLYALKSHCEQATIQP